MSMPKQTPPVPWRRVLHSRDIWFLSLMYFCYGWVLWLYMAWPFNHEARARGIAESETPGSSG